MTGPSSLQLVMRVTTHPLRAGAVFFAGILIHLYWKRCWAAKKAAREERNELFTAAIFFPTRPWVKTEHPDSSLSRFESYLSRAEKSLKICVMSIQGRLVQRLLDLLVAKHRSGVKVKVYSASSPGTLKCATELKAQGIEWRYKRHAYSTTMHHKFVIIDDLSVMTGSLNWTSDALENQKENVVTTSDSRIVPEYVKAFDRIWREYDPDNL